MDMTTPLQNDFKEFLKLLEENKVEYLLVGGYAVSYYGYPRTTADIDIWVSMASENAERIVATLNASGFLSPNLSPDLFTLDNSLVRMGVEPFKIEIVTKIDGVEFGKCFEKKNVVNLDGVTVSMISLADLKANKRASGRPKDLDDLENLA